MTPTNGQARARRRRALYPLGGWGPAVAGLVIVLTTSVGFKFTDWRTDEAVQKGREAAVAEATAEARRADDAICRIARTNRQKSVALLEGVKLYIEDQPADDPADRARVLAFLDVQLADAREPFPEPCTRYSL